MFSLISFKPNIFQLFNCAICYGLWEKYELSCDTKISLSLNKKLTKQNTKTNKKQNKKQNKTKTKKTKKPRLGSFNLTCCKQKNKPRCQYFNLSLFHDQFWHCKIIILIQKQFKLCHIVPKLFLQLQKTKDTIYCQ